MKSTAFFVCGVLGLVTAIICVPSLQAMLRRAVALSPLTKNCPSIPTLHDLNKANYKGYMKAMAEYIDETKKYDAAFLTLGTNTKTPWEDVVREMNLHHSKQVRPGLSACAAFSRCRDACDSSRASTCSEGISFCRNRTAFVEGPLGSKIAVLSSNPSYRIKDVLNYGGKRWRLDAMTILGESRYRGTLLREALVQTTTFDRGNGTSVSLKNISQEEVEGIIRSRSDIDGEQLGTALLVGKEGGNGVTLAHPRKLFLAFANLLEEMYIDGRCEEVTGSPEAIVVSFRMGDSVWTDSAIKQFSESIKLYQESYQLPKRVQIRGVLHYGHNCLLTPAKFSRTADSDEKSIRALTYFVGLLQKEGLEVDIVSQPDADQDMCAYVFGNPLSQTKDVKLRAPALKGMQPVAAKIQSLLGSGPAVENSNASEYSNLHDKEPVRHKAVLWSFPGSGNTMLRYTFERITGKIGSTNSVYNDKRLRSVLPGESRNDGIIVKIHPGLRSKIPAIFAALDNSAKRIVLMRNPYDAVWSWYQLYQTSSHTGRIHKRDFNASHFKKTALKWARMFCSAVEDEFVPYQKGHSDQLLLIKFEDLMREQNDTLSEMLTFLDEEVQSEGGGLKIYSHPAIKRDEATFDTVTQSSAYASRDLVDAMWSIFGKSAERYGYSKPSAQALT